VNSLDAIDSEIVRVLQAEEMPNAELARRLGLSAPATLRRVQRLRRDGIITGVRASVNPEALGYSLHAFVLVSLARLSSDADERFRTGVRRMPYVLSAYAVSGQSDVLVELVGTNTRHLQQSLTDLSRLGAERANTMLALEEFKASAPVPPTSG